jgi:hypothetical protein
VRAASLPRRQRPNFYRNDSRGNLSSQCGRGIVSSATIQRMECPGISNALRLRQSFRADGANRSKLPESLFIEAKRLMPKFAIGDSVDKDKTHSGTVVAVFTTIEGEQRYAVDMEGYGALQFIMECNLVPHETPQ